MAGGADARLAVAPDGWRPAGLWRPALRRRLGRSARQRSAYSWRRRSLGAVLPGSRRALTAVARPDARHQRADGHRRGRGDGARRLARSRQRRVPVCRRAVAGGADAGARTAGHPRADRPLAPRGAGHARRRRSDRGGRRDRAWRARDRRPARREVAVDGVVVGRPQRRQRGADHRRIAAGRQGRRATRCSPARSTAAARSKCGSRASAATPRSRTSSIWSKRRSRAARPVQSFVDRFARIYTPAVIALAVGGRARAAAGRRAPSASTWLYRALVLLVIACPCALVISTPVSIVAALSAAARQGVLIKGGALSRAAGDGPRIVAFDKTGTLTSASRLSVTDVVPVGVRRPATNCSGSPQRSKRGPSTRLRAAIVAHGRRRWRSTCRPPSAFHGRCRAAAPRRSLAAAACSVGNAALFDERARIAVARASSTTRVADARDRTLVFVAVDGMVLGAIAVADTAAPDRRAKRSSCCATHGIERVVMLTGDHRDDRGAVAAARRRRRIPRAGCCPNRSTRRSRRCARARAGGDGRRRRQRCASAGRGGCRDRHGRGRHPTSRSKPPMSR